MSRKKTQTTPPPVEDGPKQLILDPLEMTKLFRFEAEIRAAKSDGEKASGALDALLAKIDPTGDVLRLIGIVQKASGTHAKYMAKYLGIIAELEQKYGISLKDYAIDDETGALTFVQSAEAPKAQ